MTTRPDRGCRASAFGAALAVLLVLVAGCGREQAPVEAVPQLDRMLAAVDEALAAHRYGVARTRIEALVEEVQGARQAGDLDEAQADRVLAASAELLSALPTTAPRAPSSSPTPSRTPTPDAPASPAPTGGSGGSGGSGGGGGGATADQNDGGTAGTDKPGKGDEAKGSGRGGGKPKKKK